MNLENILKIEGDKVTLDSVNSQVDFNFGDLVHFNVIVRVQRRSKDFSLKAYQRIEIHHSVDEDFVKNGVVPFGKEIRHVYKGLRGRDILILF